MMTPAQLKNYEFKTAGRNAYKADDVDIFLAEVMVNYEKMFRENSELIKRINLLATKLESYQNDEADIKQAVLSAQRAADLIVKEAENSVLDSKNEAEAILAAAKGEADIIKSDAEKQAVADSELVLALATDKAEEIISKAKEKAHDILIEANANASDTVGQATRTITSESLHYDMLKKEVSEFRTSILAQYKAHIELISKLPELAVEEAKKIDEPIEENDDELSVIQDKESCVEIEEISEDVLEYVSDDNQDLNTEIEISEENDTITFISDNEEVNEDTVNTITDDEIGEPVVKTTLPYDFFEENSSLEFVESDEDEPVSEIDAFENYVGMEFDEDDKTPVENVTEADNFKVDINDLDLSLFEDTNEVNDSSVADIPTHIVVDDEDNEEDDDVSGFFESIESIDTIDEEPQEKPRGFFRKRK